MRNVLKELKKKLNKKEKLIIGITGTYGKTTVGYLIKHILLENNIPTVALLSDGAFFNNKYNSKYSYSTTSQKTLNNFIKKIEKIDYRVAIIEIPVEKATLFSKSSISLDTLILTNAYGNEEFFNTWHEYVKEISKLLENIKKNGLVIINGENKLVTEWFETEFKKYPLRIYWANRLSLSNRKANLTNTSFKYLKKYNIQTNLLGSSNHLYVYMAVKLCSFVLPMEKIIDSLEKFVTPKGRLDNFLSYPFYILIDKAKSVFQLQESLKYISNNLNKNSNLIVVTGESEPNPTKIPKIANKLLKYSDIIFLCAVDTQHSVSKINSSLLVELERKNGRVVERILSTQEYKLLDLNLLKKRINKSIKNKFVPIICFDAENFSSRKDAISLALRCSYAGDVVYINGKGDDKFLKIKTTSYIWSDYEVVENQIKYITN